MAVQSQAYPVTYSVDYPDRKLNRLTSFFRIFVVIPIAIIIALLSSGNIELGKDPFHWSLATGGVVVLPLLLMILFRQKYPKWWFDWNLALSRFSYRVCSYMALLRDEYPSTDEEQAVHFNMEYPDAKTGLEPWDAAGKMVPGHSPLYRSWFPVYCAYVSVFLLPGVRFYLPAVIRGAFLTSSSVFQRWAARVAGYAFLMVTDRYPPFSID